MSRRRVQAAVMPGPGQAVVLREVPVPDLEPGAALMKVHLSEVCGTDVHLREGRLRGVPYPIVPGHVAVGVLEEVRGRLIDVERRPLRAGDWVTFLDVHGTCHACWYCLVAKASTRCPERRVYGITYGLADGPAGGWAEAIVLKAGTRLIRVEDEGGAERFLRGGCALPTALHAVERGGIAVADDVLVLGSGPVGLALVALARLQGARHVLCIGAPEARLAAARACGAAGTLDFTAADSAAREAWVRERTSGRGADVVFEATGDPAAVVQAMRAARDGGRVVVAGQYTDRGDATFNPHADLNRRHLEVRACWGSDFSHFHRAARLASDEAAFAPWMGLPVVRYGLARAGAALDDVAAGRVVKAWIAPHAAGRAIRRSPSGLAAPRPPPRSTRARRNRKSEPPGSPGTA